MDAEPDSPSHVVCGISTVDKLAIRERQINSMAKRMSQIVTACEDVKRLASPYAEIRLVESENGWLGQSYAEKAKSRRKLAHEYKD